MTVMPRINIFRTSALACALLCSSSVAAFPFDASAYAERYIKLAENAGMKIEPGAIEPIGSDGVRMTNIRISATNGSNKTPVTISKLELTGIQEMSGATLAAEGVLMEGLSYSGKGSKGEAVEVRMESASGTGIYYPDVTQSDLPTLSVFDETTLKTSPLSVTVDGAEVLRMQSMAITSQQDLQNLTFSSGLDLQGFNVDLTAIPDPKFQAQREAIGYDRLETDIKLSADGDLKSGDLNVSEYSLDTKKVGKLNLTASFGNYTEDLVRRTQKVSADMQKLPPEQQAQAAQQLLTVYLPVTVKSFALQFDDSSITNRLVDLQAAAMGKPREEIAAMVPMMTLAAGSALKSPAFAGMLAAAVGQYMGDPKNLRISATPAEPVTIAEIMALGQTDPNALIERLSVQATANQ